MGYILRVNKFTLRDETYFGVQARNRRTSDETGFVTVTYVSAGVAKLEYARDLGSRGRETVRVRVPPSAPNQIQ